MRIYIKDIDGNKIVDVEGQGPLSATYSAEYKIGGDVIVFETDEPYVTISVDNYITTSNVFIPKGRLEYTIPFGEKLKAYHPETFKGGNDHTITIEKN